jgi:hypothetical protein
MASDLPHFQYDTPTVQVDDLVLDAEALNAYIRRAESAYDKSNVTYCVGKDCPGMGKGSPDVEATTGAELVLDCSGFAWWTTYRKGLQAHTEGKAWVRISQPLPGATTRYDPKPGKTYGHSGVIIAPGKDGNFQTLDSTDAKSPPRVGSIVYRPDGRTKWITNGGPNSRFLVSPEAIISKGGVPFNRPTNLLLAAVKHPIATGVGVAMLVFGLLGFYAYRRAPATPA